MIVVTFIWKRQMTQQIEKYKYNCKQTCQEAKVSVIEVEKSIKFRSFQHSSPKVPTFSHFGIYPILTDKRKAAHDHQKIFYSENNETQSFGQKKKILILLIFRIYNECSIGVMQKSTQVIIHKKQGRYSTYRPCFFIDYIFAVRFLFSHCLAVVQSKIISV